MMKTAWVFPGQGSQAVGMGLDLLKTAIAQVRFEAAATMLGWSVLERCQGDRNTLAQTRYTQPCLYVIESILVDLLRDQGEQPDWVAGHSLGEYVALYAAGVFDFQTGLGLVKQRAELMDSVNGGVMVALMRFDRQQLEDEIAQIPDVVIANDNSPEQVVISGTAAAVEAVLDQVPVKRVAHLPVSGAFHSPLMAPVAATFGSTLEATAFQTARIPVLSNANPMPTIAADELKARLQQQMMGSVRWREIALALRQLGTEQMVEVGPGRVLTGLMKRTCPDLSLVNMSGLMDLPNHGQTS